MRLIDHLFWENLSYAMSCMYLGGVMPLVLSRTLCAMALPRLLLFLDVSIRRFWQRAAMEVYGPVDPGEGETLCENGSDGTAVAKIVYKNLPSSG